ncbi:PTS sugar transporter subunit IIA [Lacticaseibacillus chiayiensis]|uniref:PTS sugar transporter subunit IIA n=1 Tax=Lacticaseibacillus chiayiensis TaxID=2100821 RepID=UPI001011B8D4|nr:fructose PTS transporter subunit IIA [Lacticaseibacillus chiayiensis]QVI34615.1 fructose PTS transporter subunit IIA [Lacticaseibacillus chiayiensis]RXT59002.1 PTS mannose transporter subunit IIAB [Lacticaseibacillus chiayiensis]
MTEEAHNFLSKKNIVIGLDAKSRDDAIRQLAQVLERNGTVTDANAFAADVLKRESMTTTGIGHNIAIPHGKSKSVKQATMVFAKNKTPLEWHSLDGSKVQIIFLMAVNPDDPSKEHLRILAKLSGKLVDDDFVDEIKKENDPARLLKIFADEEE